MATVEITDDNFRELYQNNDIIVLDFWAIWCGPCHQFAPIFEETAKEYPEIVFGKVETEAQPKISQYFEIRSIPTIIIIREGLELFRNSGVLPKEAFKDIIEKARTADMSEIYKKVEQEEQEANS